MILERTFNYYDVLKSLEKGIEAEFGVRGTPGVYLTETERALSSAFKDAKSTNGPFWREVNRFGEFTRYPLESVAQVYDHLIAQATSRNDRTRRRAARGGINARVLFVAENVLQEPNFRARPPLLFR